MRRDFVQNSNDSYWLANPDARLEGFPQIIGTDEGRPQSFRTRLGITQIRDRQAGTDGLPGTGFGRQWLQDVLFADRHYSAEIMLDGVLTLCAEESHLVNVGGQIVDVSEACDVLAAWDRANKLTSVGPHLWTEFWNRASNAPNLFAVPFDPADPVNTPRGVNLASVSVRARIMSDLAAAVKRFADANIPLNVAWGEIQFDTRGGETIPIHGGSGTSGVYNAISPAALIPGVGFTPIVSGSSYIQAVTFTRQRSRRTRRGDVLAVDRPGEPALRRYDAALLRVGLGGSAFQGGRNPERSQSERDPPDRKPVAGLSLRWTKCMGA